MTTTDTRTSSTSSAAVRRWMRANAADHRDRVTGEVNATSLTEAWDRECADGGATLDPDHPAWDVAAGIE